MTKRKDSGMDLGASPDEAAALNAASGGPDTLPSGLKPKLDLIFSEVEQKLPDIDFDFSDVDSDTEEPVIFHQHLKSLGTEEDKDLDTSQHTHTDNTGLTSSLPVTKDNTDEDKNKNATMLSAPLHIYDNDLAYELQQSGIEVTSWSDIPVPDSPDSNRGAHEDTGVASLPDTSLATKSTKSGKTSVTGVSWGDVQQNKAVTSWNDVAQARLAGDVDSNRTGEGLDLTGLSLNSLDDKGIQRQLEREKTRNEEKDMATQIVSPRGPVLSTQVLDNIDLDNLLQSLTSDNQFAPQGPKQAWSHNGSGETANRPGERRRQAQSTARSSTSESTTLIQKLAMMSMDYGADLTDVDPTTGASTTNLPDNDRHAIQTRQASGVDLTSTTIAAPNLSQSQMELMEAALSSEIQGFLDPILGDKNQKEARKEKPKESKPVVKSAVKPAAKPAAKSAAKTNVSSCGTNTTDFKEYTLTARPPKQDGTPEEMKIGVGNKEPTVVIDLRNFDQIRQEQQNSIKKVQKVLGINPVDSHRADSSDSEDDVEDWREQRRKFKQHSATNQRASSAPVTSKPPVGSRPQPPRVINMADLPARLQPRQPEVVDSTADTVQTEAQRQRQAEDREKEKQIEAIRKLREQRESERQTKLRLQKRLEALRPSASVSGRHDAAENTPTVFDMEASYEPAPHSLPPVLSPDVETLLLTIHLSSNGEIVLHRGSGNKSVDTGTGLSASYTTLLTWLLALVPDSYTYLQDGESSTQVSPWILPFYVVGMQQALMDNQLYLNVAVTPVEQFDAKYVPVKGKKAKKVDAKGTSAFLQHLTKFFSVNTLHSVCPWLQNMVSMEVAPAAEDSTQKPDYAYKPPLPNITTKPLSTFIQVNPDRQAAAKVFNTQVGFFWQTVDSDEARMDQDLHDKEVNYDTQNTISLVYKKIYRDPSAVMGILNRVLQLGLDLAGVRLVYPTPELMNLPKTDNASALSELDLLNNVGAVLALCIRGHAARSIWLDAIGPSDPALARRTDPNSLCALYGGESRDECLLFSPRTPARVQTELVRWFGARVPPGNVIDVGLPYTKKESLRSGSPKGRKTKKVTFAENTEEGDVNKNTVNLSEHHRPLATLTATTKSEIFLVLSPLVPPKCFGLIMASCQRRGFQVTGVRRCRLSTKKAAALGISGEGVKTFCPGSGDAETLGASLQDHVAGNQSARLAEALFPSTILLLQKENACHSAASLIEDGMVQLTLNGIMGTIQSRAGFALGSQHMIRAGRYSDSLLTALAGDFSKCFDPEIQINPNYVLPKLYTNPECEQITVLVLLGHDILKSSGLFVGKLLSMVPYSKAQPQLPFTEGLELLGMKWLPQLTNTQAKEVTPCEVGDRLWKDSLHTLTSEPCLALALRGVNVFRCLEKVVQPRMRLSKEGQPYHVDTLNARNPEEAYTLIRMFFTERELFADPLARPLASFFPPFVPSQQQEKKLSVPVHTEECIFDIMLAGPRPFTTLLIMKPRAFQRHLTKFLKKLTQEGFKTVGMKLLILTEEQAKYLIPEDTENEMHQRHVQYLCSGPCLCMSVQRENAVKKLLDCLGPEDPQSARRLSQFFWRGVFGADTVCNGIYASSDYQRAVADQKMFFPDGLCCEETEITLNEEIVCPAIDKEMYIKFSSVRNVIEQTAQASGAVQDSHQLLTQTTCIVLSPMLMRKLGAHHGYVDVIDGLVAQGFEFVGGRMVWFSQEQAKHFLCLIDAGNFQQVPMLTSGGCIVLALQRDNAVLAFDSILRETFSTESCQGKSVTDSLLHKYGPLILRPSDLKQAHKLLGFFFDQLLPSSQVQIVPKLE